MAELVSQRLNRDVHDGASLPFLLTSIRSWLQQLPPQSEAWHHLTDRQRDRIHQLAVLHGVAPILFIQNELDQCQDRSAQLAQRDFQANCALQLHSQHQSQTIAKALQAVGIQARLLKGPALAEQYYRSIFSREASIDVDILIDPHDVVQADVHLRSLGYRYDRGSLTAATIKTAITKEHQVTYRQPNNPITIDLHWRLDRPLCGPNPKLDAHSHQATLWTVLLHGQRHRWCRLKYHLDFICVVQHCHATFKDMPAASLNRLRRSYKVIINGITQPEHALPGLLLPASESLPAWRKIGQASSLWLARMTSWNQLVPPLLRPHWEQIMRKTALTTNSNN